MKPRDDNAPADAMGVEQHSEVPSDDEYEGQEQFDQSALGLIRMWWQLCTPGLLLTGVTTGMEQGAWGHYQLSNPPFLVQSFQFDPVSTLRQR